MSFPSWTLWCTCRPTQRASGTTTRTCPHLVHCWVIAAATAWSRHINRQPGQTVKFKKKANFIIIDLVYFLPLTMGSDVKNFSLQTHHLDIFILNPLVWYKDAHQTRGFNRGDRQGVPKSIPPHHKECGPIPTWGRVWTFIPSLPLFIQPNPLHTEVQLAKSFLCQFWFSNHLSISRSST